MKCSLFNDGFDILQLQVGIFEFDNAKRNVNKKILWLTICISHYEGSYCEQDSENDHIYHSELFTLSKRTARGEPQKLSFTVPIFEPHPPQYYIRAVSDSWLQSESFYTISLHNLALPEVI